MCRTTNTNGVIWVVSKEFLGSRPLGYRLYDGSGILEMTDKQIKDAIKAGRKVRGLIIGKDNELELDASSFYTDLMEHRFCNSYNPTYGESMLGKFFIVLSSKKDEAGNTVYESLSTKFEHVVLTENELKVYLDLGIVSGGAKLLEDGKIILVDEGDSKEMAKQENSPTVKMEKSTAKPSVEKEKKVETETVVKEGNVTEMKTDMSEKAKEISKKK